MNKSQAMSIKDKSSLFPPVIKGILDIIHKKLPEDVYDELVSRMIYYDFMRRMSPNQKDPRLAKEAIALFAQQMMGDSPTKKLVPIINALKTTNITEIKESMLRSMIRSIIKESLRSQLGYEDDDREYSDEEEFYKFKKKLPPDLVKAKIHGEEPFKNEPDEPKEGVIAKNDPPGQPRGAVLNPAFDYRKIKKLVDKYKTIMVFANGKFYSVDSQSFGEDPGIAKMAWDEKPISVFGTEEDGTEEEIPFDNIEFVEIGGKRITKESLGSLAKKRFSQPRIASLFKNSKADYMVIWADLQGKGTKQYWIPRAVMNDEPESTSVWAGDADGHDLEIPYDQIQYVEINGKRLKNEGQITGQPPFGQRGLTPNTSKLFKFWYGLSAKDVIDNVHKLTDDQLKFLYSAAHQTDPRIKGPQKIQMQAMEKEMQRRGIKPDEEKVKLGWGDRQ